jgi:hypothetical protein
MTMSTLIRSALAALALIGTISAASANPNPNADAKHYFEQQQREGS